jgi:heme exporter protein B
MTALWTHLVKDLRIEWRSRDAINSMLFFALLVVVLFSMAFDPQRRFSREIAGGVSAWPRCSPPSAPSTRPGPAKSATRSSTRSAWPPPPAPSLFLAKVLANFLFVTIVQVVLAPVFLVFYNLHV